MAPVLRPGASHMNVVEIQSEKHNLLASIQNILLFDCTFIDSKSFLFQKI